MNRNSQMIYPYLGGSAAMRQSLRPCDGTDPAYTTEDFANAVTANVVTTAEPEQVCSPYDKAWIQKLITMIDTALTSFGQQWYSDLLPDDRNKLASLLPRVSEDAWQSNITNSSNFFRKASHVLLENKIKQLNLELIKWLKKHTLVMPLIQCPNEWRNSQINSPKTSTNCFEKGS